MQLHQVSENQNDDETESELDIYEVKKIEFFQLASAPDESKGDWDDEFGVFNYFIPELSITSYDDEIFSLNGKVYKEWDGYIQALEEAAKGIVNIKGEAVSGAFLAGLILSAEFCENDQEAVYEKLDEFDADLEFIDGSDDLSSDWANSFGVRIWSADIDNLTIKIEDNKIVEQIDGDYEDVNDFMALEEDSIKKTIGLINKPN